MLMIEDYAPAGETGQESLTLPFDLRQKSRLRAQLDSGGEVSIVLERGRVMRSGDLLKAKNGTIVEVRAAPETVSTVSCRDSLTMTRGAYHLGNRHVPLQIGEGFLRYQHDHVLDEMMRQLGFHIVAEEAAFEPEAGAYAGGSLHSHGHSHSHSDGHSHSHGHSHGDHDAHDHRHEHDQPRHRPHGGH